MLHTILIFIIIPLFSVLGYTKIHPQFGKPGRGRKVQQSPNFNAKKNKFFNLIPTKHISERKNLLWTLIEYYYDKRHGKYPQKPLPTKKLEHREAPAKLQVTWLGHSTLLIQKGDISILTDPVLGEKMGPKPVFFKPFPYTQKTTVEDLRKIDMVLISHDHFDHLDYATILKLKDKTQHFIVPLGVGGHLSKWGISAKKITELDWWESAKIANVEFTCTPARHFSGRTLKQDQTLWASWVIKMGGKKLFFTGDTGYFDEFKKIGKKYGPFDLAMIECGAYDKHWAEIHMLPEQSVQVAVDLKAKAALPIHWGKFDLALHPWEEPVIRFKKAIKTKKIRLLTPKIGETIEVEKERKFLEWWRG